MSGKKKLIIGIILSTIATVFLIFFFGLSWLRKQAAISAEKNRILNSIEENGDFLYHVVRLNIKGEEITNVTMDSKCVESYITILGLSEEGKQKEIIVVPQYIDEIEVKEIGRSVSLRRRGFWESDVLKKVYIPFQVVIWKSIITKTSCPNLEKVIVLENELPSQRLNKINNIYITSFHHEGKDNCLSYLYSQQGTIYCANVSYMLNYNDSLNKDYYWIDDYDYNSLITYIPDDPIREGYVFDGWYKEEECINKWDFEIDKLPEVQYINNDIEPINNQSNIIYQETKLYAKWIKMGN